ncbi:MAG: flippase-like domain-containing protein [Deltaproteobacteria bacterium]|nr:flippase-like domain-containing protein [Deltaproteobacteria bacterium]
MPSSPEDSGKRRLQFLKNALKITIAAGLIFFLFSTGKIDIGQILHSYTNPGALLAGVLCCTIACAIPIVRWWILARIQQLNVSLFDALRLTMISYFFSIFAPGNVGGDVVRAYYALRESPDQKPRVLTVALVDRGLGLHALLFLSAAALVLQPRLLDAAPGLRQWMIPAVCLFAAAMLSPLLLLWDRTNSLLLSLCGRVVGGVQAWRDAVTFYRSRPGMLGLAYLCSLGNAFFNALLIHCMMRAVGAAPVLLESLIIGPLVILANMLPFSPGGLGIAEAASAILYGAAGHAGGASGMLLTRCVVIIHALVGAVFLLLYKKPSIQQGVRNPSVE